MKPIFQQAILLGATLDPFASFLLIRGLKTLALRMERQCDNAAKIAGAMRGHPRVERVYYPDGQLAQRGGAVVSIVLRGDVGPFVAALEHIPIVTTLGGVSTTITLPALSSHRSVPAAERARLGVVDKLVRISVGIEDADDVIAELTGALGVIITPRKVLTIRLGAVGDALTVLPAIAALRRLLPNAVIHHLVERGAAPVVQGLAQLDDVIVVPRDEVSHASSNVFV